MTTTKKNAADLAEVKRFTAAQERLEEFKAKHKKIFEELYSLVEEYNDSLEDADKAVRSTGQSCGPFVKTKTLTKYDADKLFDALGHDGFLKAGGIIETVKQYSVDKAKFESNIASGDIPQELVDEVRTIQNHYKKIEKLVL